ncbi:hypothetical protein BIU97_00430 [Curtobacterium sp. MCBA15_009]|nr:hypothetical protein BIU92_07720 [Curtobacterium sp. MCBA15_003]OII15987.1 hypothetical protein BIU97_00430 [Curtobacterium sp. MCBA15_009]OII33411.1 hypothetical protein BIU94_14175 [Curtobacterium sp. MMLR14_006]
MSAVLLAASTPVQTVALIVVVVIGMTFAVGVRLLVWRSLRQQDDHTTTPQQPATSSPATAERGPARATELVRPRTGGPPAYPAPVGSPSGRPPRDEDRGYRWQGEHHDRTSCRSRSGQSWPRWSPSAWSAA